MNDINLIQTASTFMWINLLVKYFNKFIKEMQPISGLHCNSIIYLN